MTEDQRNIGYLLGVLHATRKMPRPIEFFASELSMVRGNGLDIHGLMDAMIERGLVECLKDGLGVKRYLITKGGIDAWDAL